MIHILYSIADFNFKFDNKFDYFDSICKDFISHKAEKDFEIFITKADIEYERINSDSFDLFYEGTAAFRHLSELLPLHNAFVLHSACFDVDGVGVAFAAHSGTGKTTHMRLWQDLLGDRMTVVNGDKPIVRFFDTEPEVPYAYGTPWNGKEHLGCNMRTPMKHICFIERAEENSCEPMDASEAIDLIFNQVYMPKDPMAVVNTMQLINRFISSCKLWKIKCNMDISAAEVAYKTIFPEG